MPHTTQSHYEHISLSQYLLRLAALPLEEVRHQRQGEGQP